MRGQRFILVTLTFDRSKFESPLAAFEFVKRNKSVSRAIGAFLGYIGAERIEYLCKLELQAAGWPHFHVLLRVPDSAILPRRGAFDEFWPHGHSNVAHEANPSYLAKYAAKVCENGGAALALSGLPADNLRWISTSRNFWGDSEPQSYAEPGDSAACAVADEPESVSSAPEPVFHPDRPAGSGASLFDRVSNCGFGSVVKLVRVVVDDSGVEERRTIFRRKSMLPFDAFDNVFAVHAWQSCICDFSGVPSWMFPEAVEQDVLNCLHGMMEGLVSRDSQGEFRSRW